MKNLGLSDLPFPEPGPQPLPEAPASAAGSPAFLLLSPQGHRPRAAPPGTAAAAPTPSAVTSQMDSDVVLCPGRWRRQQWAQLRTRPSRAPLLLALPAARRRPALLPLPSPSCPARARAPPRGRLLGRWAAQLAGDEAGADGAVGCREGLPRGKRLRESEQLWAAAVPGPGSGERRSPQ